MAQRKGRISPADAERAVELILTLPIVIESQDGTILRRLRAVTREYGLSAYDGCYLELAQRLGLPLATLDRNLATAAEKSGIPLLL